MCSVTFFFENHAVYEIMWKNIVEQDRPQMTLWSMRVACWIPKATNTHSQYVINISLPLEQWLHERSSMVRCTRIACLVLYVCGTCSLVEGEMCQHGDGANVWERVGGSAWRMEENAYRGVS
jgi:hypothetical protein